MPLDSKDIETRFMAFQEAAKFHIQGHNPCSHEVQAVIHDAEKLYHWLTRGSEDATKLVISAGLPYEQGDLPPEDQEGAVTVAISLSDTQQVDLNVQPVDSKGQPTDDPSLTWSVDDESVASLTVDPADPKHVTVVAGNPGVATVTVSDGTITGAEAVTVTAGAAAAFNVVAGTPTEQAPAGGGGGPVNPPPAATLYTFAGADPTQIDTTEWAVADVVDDGGNTLYTFIGSDPTTIDATVWPVYTGATSPAPSAGGSPTP